MTRQSMQARMQRFSPEQIVETSQAAIDSMNPALRRKYDRISQQLKSHDVSNLRFNHVLGTELMEVENDPETYTNDGLKLLLAALKVRERAIREVRAFAREYTTADLEDLLTMRREDVGFAIHFGHVRYLLSIPDKEDRRAFTLRALENLWDPKTLREKIQKKYGTKSPHGAPMKCPRTESQQLRQIREVSRTWLTKYQQVWNGTPTEANQHNIFENLLAATPDVFHEDDLESIQQVREYFDGIETACRESKGIIARIEEYISTCLSAQAAHSQDERREEADTARANRRQTRVIDTRDDDIDDDDEIARQVQEAADLAEQPEPSPEEVPV